MIVAKTGMRKLPKTCKDCKYSEADWASADGWRMCVLTGRACHKTFTPHGNLAYGKNANCPLVELEIEGSSK